MSIHTIQFAVFIGNQASPINALEAGGLLCPNRSPNAFNEVGPGQSVAVFSDLETVANVVSAPGRVDLVISRNTGERPPGSLPLDPSAVRSEYLDRLASFSKSFGASRLSVIIKSSKLVETQSDAIEAFKASVPDVGFPNGTNEIDFRINVPRRFRGIDGLQMNRLHRWTTAGLTPIFLGQAGKIYWQLSDEVDINSSGEAVIDPGESLTIFGEMFDEALHHAGSGSERYKDVPDGR